jgi:hypothetical protein
MAIETSDCGPCGEILFSRQSIAYILTIADRAVDR